MIIIYECRNGAYHDTPCCDNCWIHSGIEETWRGSTLETTRAIEKYYKKQRNNELPKIKGILTENHFTREQAEVLLSVFDVNWSKFMKTFEEQKNE